MRHLQLWLDFQICIFSKYYPSYRGRAQYNLTMLWPLQKLTLLTPLQVCYQQHPCSTSWLLIVKRQTIVFPLQICLSTTATMELYHQSHIPSGQQASITSIDSLPLNFATVLKNMFGAPSFKEELISVSRFTKDLNCSVIFFLFGVFYTTWWRRWRLIWVNNIFITWFLWYQTNNDIHQ